MPPMFNSYCYIILAMSLEVHLENGRWTAINLYLALSFESFFKPQHLDIDIL